MKLDEIKKEENRVKDVHYLDDYKKSMLDGFRNGYKMGDTTHFPIIDNHFRFSKKEVTIWGGYGGHGKSTLLMQMLLLRAINNRQKTAIFSPENMPIDYYYNDLIHTLIGKSTIQNHHNKMTQIEYEAGMEFIKDYFYLIYPENDEPTPEYINKRFEETIKKHGVEFCVTDPFNQLDHDWDKSGRDDRYISLFLTKESRFAQINDIYKIIVAHCKSTQHPFDDNGLLKKPTVFSLAGGAMWNNKSDNVTFTHRYYKHCDPTNTSVSFISDKIRKQKVNGRPGEVIMTFDPFSNRYSIDGINSFQKCDEYIRKELGL